jgi:hypothetical protein
MGSRQADEHRPSLPGGVAGDAGETISWVIEHVTVLRWDEGRIMAELALT